MAAMSDYLEEVVLEAIFNDGPWPDLSSIYLALALTNVFVDSDVAPFTNEASGAAYARVDVSGSFGIADAGGGQWKAVTSSAIGYPLATGDYSGPVVGWGLMDSLTAGNLIVHGTFTTPTAILSGQMAYIPAGYLEVEAQ